MRQNGNQSRLGAFRGISSVEVIVAVLILTVLVFVVYFYALPSRWPNAPYALNKMRQLREVTKAMSLDGVGSGNTNLAWPGDSGGRFETWSKALVPAYLSRKEFLELVSLPSLGVKSFRDMPRMSETAVRVYGVSSNSSNGVIFLTSANFTNTALGGVSSGPHERLFRDSGFVALRKDGNGRFYRWAASGDTNFVEGYVPILTE